jgi:multidrug resistance protein
MGMGMVGPILPLFGKTFGISTAMVGFLITSFGLARMVLDLPAGIISEKYGRRPVLIGGPFLLAIGSAFCALSVNYWQLVLSRFLQGAGSAFYTTAAMTAVADLSEATNRGRAMALYQGSILIGTGLGPALGGLVAGWFNSFRAPFFCFAVLGLLATIWVWLVLPETRQKTTSSAKTNLPSAAGAASSELNIWSLMRNSNFLLAGLVTFSVFFMRAGAQNELIPLIGAERLGLGMEQVGFSLTLAALANLAVLSPAGYLADHYGRKIVITPANIISGLALITFTFSQNYILFLLGNCLYGIASGLGGTTPAAYVTDIVPRSMYGQAMGLFRTFGDVGFVVAPVLLGWLVDAWGYDVALWFNALLMVASALAFGLWAQETTFHRRERKQPE